MNKIILLVALIASTYTTFAQNANTAKHTDGIQWISLQEAYNRTQKEPRKTIVDVYTQWCGWCKVMDRQTYTNPEVIEYLNKNFYMVKLDAETHEEISVGGQKYTFDAQHNANQAAVLLLQGKMSYPTTVFLDAQYNMIQPLPGYLDAKTFHQVITFFGGDNFKKETFDQYKEGTYKESFRATKL
ncbi:thioredoxin family protein [Emticicia sp. 17c]|uniref:thioredoxin family protein n=1 Tax=Emticicia sp. 17c TaxID=3127704 RepID=UPI00301C6411